MTDEDNNNNTEERPDGTHVIPLNASDIMDQIFDRFMANYSPFGFHAAAEDTTFHPLPYHPEPDDEHLLKIPWRIILELYQDNQRMLMGIDLYGDVILGRGESQPGKIVIDLDSYQATQLGVSRAHAMLRPASNQIYIIDQGSTNGTTVNSVRSGRGVATAINNDDMIRLGNMVLIIHILQKP